MNLCETVVKILQEQIAYHPHDSEMSDEDFDFDPAQLSYDLAKENKIYISGDKDLKYFVTNKNKVIGALFHNENSDYFSFDIVVDKKYQSQGIGTKLSKIAISIFKELKEIYGDDFYCEVEAVNPTMASILIKLGFKVKYQLTDRHILTLS